MIGSGRSDKSDKVDRVESLAVDSHTLQLRRRWQMRAEGPNFRAAKPHLLGNALRTTPVDLETYPWQLQRRLRWQKSGFNLVTNYFSTTFLFWIKGCGAAAVVRESSTENLELQQRF